MTRPAVRRLRCEVCRVAYGLAWGPVKRGRFLVSGGRSRVHLCPGNAGNVTTNRAGMVARRKGI